MRRVSSGAIAGFFVAGLALVATGALADAGSEEAKKLKNPVAVSPESIKAGQAAYQKYCRFCHGADATGNGPQAPKDTHPPNLVDDKFEHAGTDGEAFVVIRDGIGPKFDMKPYKGKLTDQQIWSVINYLHSLAPPAKAR